MSTHNICFHGEILKMIPKLSPNTFIICPTLVQAYRHDFEILVIPEYSIYDEVGEHFFVEYTVQHRHR